MDALTTPLPKAWQRVRLGDIFFITAGGDLSKLHYSNTKQSDFNYPIYSNAIEKKGLYGYSSFFIIKNKSITITARGTIGVAFFRDYPYVPIGRLLVLQPKISNIDCRFYAEYINSKVEFNTEQTTIPQLTIPKVALCEIPLPPLNEQIAIANILSDVDRYLYSLDALILKKESVKKALSFELLSQRKRLKGFNQAWQRVKVKDFGIIITGSTPLTQISEYWNGTISWITPTDINDNKDIFNSERKITQKGLDTIRMIPKNSVLVTCIASIGKNAILRVNGACNQQINAIIPNKDFNADFIYYLMENNKQYLLGKAGVTATYIISKQVFEEIDFFVPKDLDEQIAIANILSGLDNEIISLKNKKRQFENIKKTLNHDLMSAKIRVLKK
ncbi:restriction endonuclease subunit S [Helicobacter pylori]|uniref:restriction endonuclease subunit S n=1 Tax=Helicobacter pylori TaxID=210 RepID=UPI0009A2DF1F|nr:restriction endonuclease subunit S [Helicobacter pylori]NHA16974.1 restriction endonuclease subunit S [Helicobacter pylori]OPG39578.1 type I restriction endonuclease subunit S [Helicobacter pylori]